MPHRSSKRHTTTVEIEWDDLREVIRDLEKKTSAAQEARKLNQKNVERKLREMCKWFGIKVHPSTIPRLAASLLANQVSRKGDQS